MATQVGPARGQADNKPRLRGRCHRLAPRARIPSWPGAPRAPREEAADTFAVPPSRHHLFAQRFSDPGDDELTPTSQLTGGVQIPLVGPPGDSPGEVLQPSASAACDVSPGLPDTADELRVMCKTVVEPVVLSTKADQDASGPTMASDHNLFGLGHPEVARQVILHPG